MNEAKNALKDRSLVHDDDLHEALGMLLDRAAQRQMWLLFLDDDDRLAGPLMPMDDYPQDPHALITTDDLGELPQAQTLLQRCDMLREITGNAHIVLAWEREGGDGFTADDRAWATAMGDAADLLDVPLRAQFVVHSGGVRQFHADDRL